jgi:hypothetical protein
MIPVNRPYDQVNTLARKDKSGYTDPVEYNRHLRDAQHILMTYYISMLEAGQPFPENLNPFMTRVTGAYVTNNVITRPSTLRYILEVYAGYATNDENNKTFVQYYQANYAGSGEVGSRKISPIRKGVLTNPFYYLEENTIRFEPDEVTHATVRFIKLPPDATYAYTEDIDNDRLVFDANTSVDLIWLPQDEHNIVDLLLFAKGLETRDSALMQWVQGKRQLVGGIN